MVEYSLFSTISLSHNIGFCRGAGSWTNDVSVGINSEELIFSKSPDQLGFYDRTVEK